MSCAIISKKEFDKTWEKLNELSCETELTWLEFVGLLEFFKVAIYEAQKGDKETGGESD